MKRDYIVIAPDTPPDDKTLEYAIKNAMLLSLVEKGTITVNQYNQCLKRIKKEDFQMKSLVEKNGLTYRREGDYFIPNIELPENKPIGKYGLLRETFLKKQRNYLYNTMLMEGTLNEHLYEIDQTAKQQVADLIEKMAKAQGVDESLKASNQLSWVGKMENIQHSAEETVLNDYVYA